jgi:beta-xylosidase
VAELLIGKGADINISNKRGWMPLHYAVETGLREMAELLLAKGASVDDRDGVAVKALLGASYDGFAGKLHLDWEILHPDPSHWSLSKNAGALTITTQDGTFHRDRTDYKNLFLAGSPGEPGTDFQITTCISAFEPVAEWKQAGLICWNGENDILKLTYECHSFGGGPEKLQRITAVGTEIQEAGDAVFRTASFNIDQQLQGIWLRLTKQGNIYKFYTSANGKTFAPLESTIYDRIGLIDNGVRWGNGTVKHVGIFANNGSRLEATEIDASFDFFEIRILPPE